jgi:hypothetical protein|tara:strand:+ start:902 stop:1045 length:144 start_codon:yes stop_codon:yes gene_type:complete
VSAWGTIRKPLSNGTCHRKIITALAIITFIMAWNQFVWPLRGRLKIK